MKSRVMVLVVLVGSVAQADTLVCQNGVTAKVAKGYASVNGGKYLSLAEATPCGDLYLLSIPALGMKQVPCILPNSPICKEMPQTCGHGYSCY